MNALPAYEVLKPIAYKGDRIEKGSIIHMDEAEAANIGEEYLKLASASDEDTSEQKETEEAEKREDEKPADETHTADTEKKPEDEKPPEGETPVQTDDKQT